MSDKPKYYVVKAEDIKWRGRTDEAGSEGMPRFASITQEQVIEDATVIRGQDMFSVPALLAYANTASVTAGTIEAVATDPDQVKKAKRIRKIADYFFERADEAMASTQKLPD